MSSTTLPQPLSTAPLAVTALVRQVRLSRGIELSFSPAGEAQLTWNNTVAEVGRVSPWMANVLQRLQWESVAEDELQAQALSAGGPAGLFRWVENLRRLDATGMVERSVTLAGELVCSVRALGTGPSEKPPAFDPSSQQRLSRFTAIRVVDGALLASNPASHLAVELGPAALPLLAGLADWSTWDDLAKTVPDLPASAVRAALDHLVRAAAAEQATDRTGPDRDAAVQSHGHDRDAAVQWDTYDWWLHARTRNPRVVAGWGATYVGRGRFAKLDPLPEPYAGPAIDLPVPDLTETARTSSSLVAVMERRRSLRSHDDARPIDAVQLGEFLYRTARTRTLVHTADGIDVLQDRPYPGGGAVHELETYVLVRNCAGVPQGLWHYQGLDHRLVRASELTPPAEGLLAGAATAALMDHPPQLLVIIAARFGRLMWKYETIAYALTLKHVGVLLQNFYLVATDMGLAPTAIGCGDGQLFAEATGRDPMAEGSVGEFVLGSRPPGLTPLHLTQWEV